MRTNITIRLGFLCAFLAACVPIGSDVSFATEESPTATSPSDTDATSDVADTSPSIFTTNDASSSKGVGKPKGGADASVKTDAADATVDASADASDASEVDTRPVEAPPMALHARVSHASTFKNTPQIVVADTRQTMVVVEIDNPDETWDAHVASITVRVAAGASAIQSISYAWDDDWTEPLATKPLGLDGTVTFRLDEAEPQVPAFSVRNLHLIATLNDVVPSVVPGTGLPRTGSAIKVELTSLVADREAATVFELDTAAPTHTLRKSEALVSLVNIAGDVGGDGDREVVSWTVAATPVAPIAYHQFTFRMVDEGVSLCQFKLFAGKKAVSDASYRVFIPTFYGLVDLDLKTGCLTEESDVVVLFPTEQKLDEGKMKTFTLRATGTMSASGATVATSFRSESLNVTSDIGCDEADVFTINHDPSLRSAIIWSDLSEVPHSGKRCTSSKDWIADALVNYLDNVQTITFK